MRKAGKGGIEQVRRGREEVRKEKGSGKRKRKQKGKRKRKQDGRGKESKVNGVYAFGFLFMLPQLFVNYKLKSVAHLPWRAFMYKVHHRLYPVDKKRVNEYGQSFDDEKEKETKKTK
ncbi:hypothetical protein NP493_53g18025 [Ridgeia piscesae]|uniref:Lipid scramblase CLPTM1L n=1 Tax=Ridgeia piscesae TaxID=27915 RepID=A0AAD9PAY6_RIDPI|nr:hypothetical protein NP493_53g18025 [Ridgeia piscesae]